MSILIGDNSPEFLGIWTKKNNLYPYELGLQGKIITLITFTSFIPIYNSYIYFTILDTFSVPFSIYCSSSTKLELRITTK